MNNQIKALVMSIAIALAGGANADEYEPIKLPFEKFAYLRISNYLKDNGNFDYAKEGFARCVALMRHMAESRETYENKPFEDTSPEAEAAMGLLQGYLLALAIDLGEKGNQLEYVNAAAEVFLEREVPPYQEKYASWTAQTNLYPSVFRKPLHPLMIEHRKCMELGAGFRSAAAGFK